MHTIDIATVEMALDVMKFAISRITSVNPEIGKPTSYDALKAAVGETITDEGIGGEKAFTLFKEHLLKATIPIDHPRHLAFVPADPTRAALMFDLVTAVSSIHGSYWMEGAGGIFCEMEAMRWLVSLTGMPEGSFGVFTSGGTAANLSALVAARDQWRKKDPNRNNYRGLILTSGGAHSSIKSMANVIDSKIMIIETEEDLSGQALEHFIQKLPKKERKRLFAVVATAGTTNAGIIDDLDGIADVCKAHDLWFHVDGAYGGAALAVEEIRPLFKGIEKCDSFTIDPHKWLFTPYDCGAIIYKDPDAAKQTHSQAGSYLDIFQDEGARGFNPSDYQIQLTRRLRGMPLWFSLAMHGTDVYKKAIHRGIELAQIAGEIINKEDHVELVRPPSLSIVLFRRKGWTAEDYTQWTYRNHKNGYALVTPTKWKSKRKTETISRFCFISPDTTEEDIRGIINTMK